MTGPQTRHSTLETLQFTLELLKRIPRNRNVSAPELHQQLSTAGFQRDLRTIQRQLDELTRHFDIDRDERSKPYGYQWKSNARGLTVPGLNEKESLLLALAEQHLRNLLPAEVMRSMKPFFDQAYANLTTHDSSPSARAARDWMKKVRVVSTSQPLLPPKIDPQVFETVGTALYRNEWLDVSYRNAAGKLLRAKVMPLGLAQQGTRLYLVCRFDGYENERSLALNRMVSATVTNIGFRPPPEFDLEKFDDDGRFGFGAGKKIKLEILMDKEAALHLLESKLSPDQTAILEGDRYRIKATVTHTEQLKWWLRGFKNAVTVVSPRKLATEI